MCATLAWRETYVAQLQLKQRLTSDQGGSNYVQALGEELQQAAKGDSWGASDNDKGIHMNCSCTFLVDTFVYLWLEFVFGLKYFKPI